MSGAETPAPAPALVSREQRRRRRILFGIGALLLFSTSPVFGHHFPTGVEALLAGRDHVWAICLVALHYLLEPVHLLFHALFVGAFAYAIWDRSRAWRTLRRVLARLQSTSPEVGDSFHDAAVEAQVDPRLVRVVQGLPSPAFTAGWLQPRIYVAAALADRLNRDELVAVLSHEGAHVRRRDPLRLSVLRFLSCTLFWIPGLRRLTEDLADETEIQADDIASNRGPLALASAILNLARWHETRVPMDAQVGFDERELLERRVKRLAGKPTPPKSRVTWRALATAALALGLAWSSGAAVAHPLATDSPDLHAEHCERLDRSAFMHLFCLGFPLPVHGEDCPHRGVSSGARTQA